MIKLIELLTPYEDSYLRQLNLKGVHIDPNTDIDKLTLTQLNTLASMFYIYDSEYPFLGAYKELTIRIERRNILIS